MAFMLNNQNYVYLTYSLRKKKTFHSIQFANARIHFFFTCTQCLRSLNNSFFCNKKLLRTSLLVETVWVSQKIETTCLPFSFFASFCSIRKFILEHLQQIFESWGFCLFNKFLNFKFWRTEKWYFIEIISIFKTSLFTFHFSYYININYM